MILPDVNVLVYCLRADSARHAEYAGWLRGVLNGNSAFGLSELALASLIRIATHPKIFRNPNSFEQVTAFLEALTAHPLCRLVHPSARHWPLFLRLCGEAGAKGNLVTDAWFAALALESGCTWITADRDYARFPGLRWQHPLDHDREMENPR